MHATDFLLSYIVMAQERTVFIRFVREAKEKYWNCNYVLPAYVRKEKVEGGRPRLVRGNPKFFQIKTSGNYVFICLCLLVL
jgi:hypothetical protein